MNPQPPSTASPKVSALKQLQQSMKNKMPPPTTPTTLTTPTTPITPTHTPQPSPRPILPALPTTPLSSSLQQQPQLQPQVQPTPPSQYMVRSPISPQVVGKGAPSLGLPKAYPTPLSSPPPMIPTTPEGPATKKIRVTSTPTARVNVTINPSLGQPPMANPGTHPGLMKQLLPGQNVPGIVMTQSPKVSPIVPLAPTTTTKGKAKPASSLSAAGGTGGEEGEDDEDAQDIEDFTDVTRLAGVNLKEEENFNIAGQDEQGQYSYEDEREPEFIDLKLLKAKMNLICRTKGVKDTKPEALEYLALALEEWMRDTLEELIKLSKHREGKERRGFHTVVTSDVGKFLREKAEREKLLRTSGASMGGVVDLTGGGAKQTPLAKKEQERLAKIKQEEEERQRTNATALDAIGTIKLQRPAPSPTTTAATPALMVPHLTTNSPGVAATLAKYPPIAPHPPAAVQMKGPAIVPRTIAPHPTVPPLSTPPTATATATTSPAVVVNRKRTIGARELSAFLHRDPWLRHSVLYYRLLAMPPQSTS